VVRWRWTWLAVPAGAGLAWALAIGPATAFSGLVAGPRQVAAYLAGCPASRACCTWARRSRAPGQWLPRQVPLALVLGAAEAFLGWLDWLHTDAAAARPARTGLIVAARALVHPPGHPVGRVLTRDGSRLGVAADGRSAAVLGRGRGRCWWPGGGEAGRRDEAGPGGAGGVTGGAAGPPGPGPAATGFRFVHAAIRRRKPVVVVDLAGQRGWLAGALTAVSAAAGAPLHQFGPAGPGYYDPLRTGDPARAAALLTGLLDWSGGPDGPQRGCVAYLASCSPSGARRRRTPTSRCWLTSPACSTRRAGRPAAAGALAPPAPAAMATGWPASPR
jgi:hypothetical protein